MRIGELARRTGVSVRALRYYEEQDLLLSRRTSGGQRVYDEDAVDRVLLTQQLFKVGLGSKDVVTFLPCVYSGTVTPPMLARLVEERDRLDERVRELAETRDRLDGVLADARSRLAGPAHQDTLDAAV